MATPEASSNSLMSVVFAKELYTLLEDCLCVFMSFVDAFARLVQVFVSHRQEHRHERSLFVVVVVGSC